MKPDFLEESKKCGERELERNGQARAKNYCEWLSPMRPLNVFLPCDSLVEKQDCWEWARAWNVYFSMGKLVKMSGPAVNTDLRALAGPFCAEGQRFDV